MKRVFNFALVAMLAVGVASCSKEGIDETGTTPVDPTAKSITFTIPAKSGIITYADPDPAGTVTANAAEKAIDNATIAVYMFDKGADNDNSLLQAVIANPTMGTSGSSTTARITLDKTWAQYDNDKHFYLVANTTAAAATSFTAKADLTSGATSLTDFLKWTTTSQGTTHLMPVTGTVASYLMMTEKVENVDLETAASAEVYFRRNVARFDIDNQVNTVGVNVGGNVTISEVKVNDANLQGLVFGYEQRPAIMTAPATGDLPKVDVTATVNAGTGKQAQASIFYLYPTVIKADGTGTQIYLKGEVQGVFKTFTLKSAADITIEANKRYKISAIDALALTFTIEVADWDEGEELTGTPDSGVAFGILAPQAADITNGTFNAIYNSIAVTASTSAFSANLAVKGTSTAGVTVEVIAQIGTGLTLVNGDIIKVTTPATDGTITYAVPYFKYTFTVSFEAGKIEADKNFTTILRVTDIASGKTEDILLYYGGAEVKDENNNFMYTMENGEVLAAVEVAGIYWAPVNVGATNTDATTLNQESCGYYYQWGRNDAIGWVANGETVPNVTGPIAYTDLNNYAGKFITGSVATFLGWLNNDDPSHVTHNDQWSATINNSPCPAGWRLPTKVELQALLDIYESQSRPLNKPMNRVQIRSNSVYLSLPVAGSLIRETGVAVNQGLIAQLWSSDHADDQTEFHTHANHITIASSSSGPGLGARTIGNSVRCVKAN